MPQQHSWSEPYVANGFQDDCAELIRKCLRVKKLSYEKFCDIWKKMDFACVYYASHSGADLAELSDEVLYIAKSYMFANTSNFEETVAGIFLVYALLNLQPFVGFSPLKIIKEDVQHIGLMEHTARSQRRYDVLYILGSMLIKGPCQYHVALRERGIENNIRKHLEYNRANQYCGGSRGVFNRQREELNLLSEIRTLSSHYMKSKQAVSGSTTLNRNLSYTNENIPLMLETSLKTVIFGYDKDNGADKDHKKDKSSPNAEQQSSNCISSVKQKAMRSSINPMRHLTGLNERLSGSPEKSPQKASKKSPKKTTKRKGKSSGTSSRIVESTDESDSHMSLHDSDDSVNRDDESAKSDMGKTVEIRVDELPVLITAPNENECEIEIIDQLSNTREVGNAKKIQAQSSKGTTKNSVKKGNAEKKDVIGKVEKKIRINFKKTLKKKEKRDLKKNHAKSQFSRLGLLDMLKVTKGK